MSRAGTAPARLALRVATLSLVATVAAAGMGAGAQAEEGATGPATGTTSEAGEASTGASADGGAGDAQVEMETLNVPATEPAASDRRMADGPASGGSTPTDEHGEHGEEQVVAKLQTTRTASFGLVGVTWRGDYDATGLHVQIRTHRGGDWSAWEELDVHTAVDQSADPDARGGTVPTWVGGADGIGVRLLTADGTAPVDVQVALIDGGTGLAEEADEGGLPEGQVGRAAPKLLTAALTEEPTTDETTDEPGLVAQPDIVTRAEWGVNQKTESTCGTPRTARTMRGIALHHTAGSNNYTAADAPGIVRGIHRYHTVAQNWCDIGYNFLVDKYGVIYEGRRGGILKQVRGAHAGDWLVNKWTTGISMMGNFQDAQMTTALKDAVVHLSAWRLSLFGRDALDTMLIEDVRYQRLSGHRDFKSTACPGKNGYHWLNNGMRQAVQAVIDDAPPPPTEPEPEPEPEPVLRYAGTSRYSTAASIAEESFPEPVDAVFLASGEEFPDALSGGPAAALRGAPVLLVRPDGIPAETAAELTRLQPGTIFVLGGEGAVSSAVFTQAQSYAPTVTRLSGLNRYYTGVSVSRHFWRNGASTVYLASGQSYPDALAGGALAARTSAPILLAGRAKLARAVEYELGRLDPSKVVLLGGTGALSEEVATQVTALLPGATVTRLAGPNRYATSAEVARYGWSVGGERAYFAAGGNFPDALAGVPAAATSDAPLLLARRGCLPESVAGELARLAPEQKVLLGGTSALSQKTLTRTC